MDQLIDNKKRNRDDCSSEKDLELDLPEVKRLKENLLNEFDVDDDEEFCTKNWDLDSFMKSFEDEITVGAGDPAEVVDLTSESGESRPDLGFLLEATDDDLGIPPNISLRTELDRVESDSSEFWNDSGYDSFEFGFGAAEYTEGYGGGEYVALDGLFDHSDLGFGSGDYPFRSETLPAQ